MKAADIPAVSKLLKKYLDTIQMAQEFSDEEFAHWMLNEATPSEEQVVFPYVVEQDGKITDFFSFYRLESTIINNPKHDTLRVAYLFYYASETAFQKGNKDKVELKKRLNELMYDALILAKKVSEVFLLFFELLLTIYKANFDVMNALTLLDNPLFLTQQKFGPGDGRLHYYLYNYRTTGIPGGMNEAQSADEKLGGGVGVVML
jgi:glycylpeptide N-tetradecanoyltransferase